MGGKLRFLMLAGYAPSLIGFRGHLIDALQAQGLQVHAAAPGLDAESAVGRALIEKGVTVHRVAVQRTGQNPVADLHTLWDLWQLMRRIQPDYVLGYTIKPVIYGSLAAWLAGVKKRIAMVEGLGFVFTPTEARLSARRRLLKTLVQGLYRLGLSAATKAIFLNPDDLREFVQSGLVAQSKIFMLGGIGVDLTRWPVAPPVTHPVTFLFVGRLLREKGIEQFSEAARQVKQQHPAARFVVLGGLDDNPGAMTADDVNRWVQEGILEWYGHVPVQPWMQQASVFVLPSFREGVPVSTQEAMATGRAIITTDAPGCRETVVDGENGFLVPVKDHDALAVAMTRFIVQPELISVMGQRSRVMAEDKYDVYKVNARMLEIMETA